LPTDRCFDFVQFKWCQQQRVASYTYVSVDGSKAKPDPGIGCMYLARMSGKIFGKETIGDGIISHGRIVVRTSLRIPARQFNACTKFDENPLPLLRHGRTFPMTKGAQFVRASPNSMPHEQAMLCPVGCPFVGFCFFCVSKMYKCYIGQ
jgi:hypothetical protein